MAEVASDDKYASQKANIRDTVKYLATAYAACGTVIFAGVSLSGLGALPPTRLVVAIVTGGIALTCVLAGLKAVSDMLIGDFCLPNTLEQRARIFLDEYHEDLLPAGYNHYDDFLAAYRREIARVTKVRETWRQLPPLPALNDPGYADALNTEKRVKGEYDEAIAITTTWRSLLAQAVSAAQLYLLQEQLKVLQARLLRLTLIGIIFFGIAVYVVTQKTEADCSTCQSVSLSAPKA